MLRMKKVVVLSLISCLILAFSASALAGGYYITGDSDLGDDLVFYVPADYVEGSLTYDSSGNLFNLTSSSIYLYCPDYPDYTIYAPRFSGFQYRPSSGSGYTYADLLLHNVSDTNVEILDDSPALAVGSDKILVMILAVLIVGVGAYVLLRR